MRATRKRIRSHLLLCFLFSSFARSRTLYSHTYRKDNSIIRCEETLHNKRLGSATFVFSNRGFHQDVALLDHNVKTSIRNNEIKKICILRFYVELRCLDYRFNSIMIRINNMQNPLQRLLRAPHPWILCYHLCTKLSCSTTCITVGDATVAMIIVINFQISALSTEIY